MSKYGEKTERKGMVRKVREEVKGGAKEEREVEVFKEQNQ